MAPYRDDFAGESTKTAFHAIAGNGAADLLGDGKADALNGLSVLAVTDEEDESRHCRALAGVCGKKIRPFFEDD